MRTCGKYSMYVVVLMTAIIHFYVRNLHANTEYEGKTSNLLQAKVRY